MLLMFITCIITDFVLCQSRFCVITSFIITFHHVYMAYSLFTYPIRCRHNVVYISYFPVNNVRTSEIGININTLSPSLNTPALAF